ncbi:hypothetical protein RND71_005245 [Anisodus tanguticus]|uniref:Uncharacterized protein n=1 Tax=Anisodus tanguticus TaxID=243964 RepID=A0AAE1SS14_9SOLA|nr:hypothetical protein RND71_005245 [Anisodus tanguticus]
MLRKNGKNQKKSLVSEEDKEYEEKDEEDKLDEENDEEEQENEEDVETAEKIKSFSIAKSGARMPLDDHNDLTVILWSYQEFAIVTGMRCYPPPQPIPTVTLKKPVRTAKDVDLLDLVGKSCKEKNSLEHLKSRTVVHPWLVLTIREILMSFLASFVALEFEHDVLIDQFKVELAGVTTITIESSGVNGVNGAGGDCVGVGGGVDGAGIGDIISVNVGGGGGGVDDVVAGGDGVRDDDDNFHGEFSSGVGGYTPLSSRFSSIKVGTSKVPSCVYQCKTCKNKTNELIKKVEELTKAQTENNALIQELISKRGVNPSKQIIEPYTPIEFRKKRRAITKALANISSKTFA